jgi:hypothetical protein
MHLGCYIFYFFGWCVLLYFILWVGIVQNSNLIWIQMNWKLRKDLEIRKVFLFSIWPWAKIDFPQKWPSRTAPSPPLLGPTRPTSALPGPDPTQWPGISSDLAGLTLHRVLHGGFYPLSVLNRFFVIWSYLWGKTRWSPRWLWFGIKSPIYCNLYRCDSHPQAWNLSPLSNSSFRRSSHELKQPTSLRRSCCPHQKPFGQWRIIGGAIHRTVEEDETSPPPPAIGEPRKPLRIAG